MEGMKSKLSTLRIFATLNYLYCDVVTLMDPHLLQEFLAGSVGGVNITPAFLVIEIASTAAVVLIAWRWPSTGRVITAAAA